MERDALDSACAFLATALVAGPIVRVLLSDGPLIVGFAMRMAAPTTLIVERVARDSGQGRYLDVDLGGAVLLEVVLPGGVVHRFPATQR
jgi:hypothetical protein